MKLYLSAFLNTHLRYAYSNNVYKQFYSSRPSQIVYSTNKFHSLYRRISLIGDPSVSVVPVLDQWVKEGRSAEREELERIIVEFRRHKRYKHALEISQWMTDKRYFPPTPKHVSNRLYLIFRVHGVEKAEKYFDNIPKQLKGYHVYISLLHCYADNQSLDKAEALMQKLRDLGFATTPISYNVLMNLNFQMGHLERLENLLQEMEGKGISHDKYTLCTCLNACAAALDVEGIDRIVEKMNSDPHIIMDHVVYSIVANSYLKVGCVDKALLAMKNLEELARQLKKSEAFDSLLKLYVEAGKKDEMYRVWNLYMQSVKVPNKGHMLMLSFLVEFNDIDGAEKIFEKWEENGPTSYDFRIPNFLIDAFCRNGRVAKAEALLNSGITKGGKPTADTWYYLAAGYIYNNQVSEAMEALNKAIMESPPNWKVSKETLAACLDYFKGQGDVNEAEEFVRLLKEKNIFSTSVQDKLLEVIKNGIHQHT